VAREHRTPSSDTLTSPEPDQLSLGAERVSVVIPVFNRPEMVAEAVASVLHQSGVEVEVVVVDDGSTDSTGAVIDELAASEPRVIASHQANAGPSAARNAGVALSSAPWITFLDSDDLMLPGRLRSQIGAMAEDPEAAGVMGLEITEIAPGVPVPDLLAGRPPLEAAPLWFAISVLLRRSTFDEVGGFAEDLDMGEDIEWLSRLSEGRRVIRLAEPLTVRRITGDNLIYRATYANHGRSVAELIRRRRQRR
jgi:glycosyltransferase involved in cell wall biosynthesis